MSVHFFQKLSTRVEKSSSLLCIGLDPHVGQLPEPTPEAAYDFCIHIITQTHEFAAVYKPNSAFFERFGAPGLDALRRVIEAIPTDIPVLLDCKRGDIDTTAQAYAVAAYDAMGADAVTLSPYMGWDSVKPFVSGDDYSHKGAFILCKTSNKSSNDLQMDNLRSNDECVYEKVARLCESWNSSSSSSTSCTGTAGANASNVGSNPPPPPPPPPPPRAYPCVGVVAGATDLAALQRIRRVSPEVWILCPGVGAQGGEADKVCAVGLRGDGSGLLVSVSRGISKAADMAAEARRLRDAINALREEKLQQAHHQTATTTTTSSSSLLQPYQREFIDFAIAQKVLQFGEFKLKSGRLSPYFFNAGLFCSGSSLNTLARSYAQSIRESGVAFDVLFGPAYKGIPLVTAIGMAWSLMFNEDKDIAYNRKEAKDHGEGGLLVGAPVKGRRVLIVDDVITAGTAIRESVHMLRAREEAHIAAVAVCLDRQERASDTVASSAIQQVEAELGFPVLSVVRLKHLIHYVKTAAAEASTSVSVKLEDIEAYRSQYGVDY